MQRRRYGIVIARPEPDNQILELVRAFSRRERAGYLLVLGVFDETKKYHREVLESASAQVKFLGPIYDPCILRSLRAHASFYAHGHRVGGTNPSLVEALGAENAVLASDNKFNKWVAGASALYFSDEDDIDCHIESLFQDSDRVAALRDAARARHQENFTWEPVLNQYLALLEGR